MARRGGAGLGRRQPQGMEARQFRLQRRLVDMGRHDSVRHDAGLGQQRQTARTGAGQNQLSGSGN